MVYLNTENLWLAIKRKGCSAKFYPQFIGPFQIISAKPRTSNYTLELPPSYKIHPTFHVSKLKPAIANDPKLFPDREPSRPPPVSEESGDYEIKYIVDH